MKIDKSIFTLSILRSHKEKGFFQMSIYMVLTTVKNMYLLISHWRESSVLLLFTLQQYLFTTVCTQSEIYVWRSAGFIWKSLVISGYFRNTNRTLIFWAGYIRISHTMYGTI